MQMNRREQEAGLFTAAADVGCFLETDSGGDGVQEVRRRVCCKMVPERERGKQA